MPMRPAAELASKIGRALLSTSGASNSVRTWNSSVEHTLHGLRLRDSLSPSLVARVIDPFLLSHHSLALGFFNWAAQQPGYSHDSLSYHSIFKSLSFARHFSTMDTLFKQVKSQKIVLDPAVYKRLIDSLILGGRPQSAFWVLDEVFSMGREIPPDVSNRLLAALASDGCSNYAQKMFDEMRRRGIALNTLGFGVYIGRSCRNAETDQLLRLVDEVKRLNSNINGSIIALLIIHGLCKSCREMDAFYILDELRNINCKPDFMAYRIVAEAFVKTGNVYERQVVLKKKRKLGVAPRSSDYGEFILDLISGNRLSEAKEVAEVIVSGNFPIDDDVLEATIRSVSSVDPDSVVGFLSFLVSKGKSPTPATLSKLCKNLCRHKKSDHLMKVYEVLWSKDYFWDLERYKMMVWFMCKGGKVREAYNTLQEMKKKGFDADVSLYNALIEACCRADLIGPAKRLWDEMFVNGCEMNVVTYNVLIGKLSEEGEAEESLRLFRRMLEKGIQPDETTYTSLVIALSQDSKTHDALEVFRRSVEQDARISTRVLSALVLCLCRNGRFRDASKLLREIGSSAEEEREHMSAHVVLLKCTAEADAEEDVAIGIQHVNWIKQMCPSLLGPVHSELSASVCSSSNPDSVLPILRLMDIPRE